MKTNNKKKNSKTTNNNSKKKQTNKNKKNYSKNNNKNLKTNSKKVVSKKNNKIDNKVDKKTDTKIKSKESKINNTKLTKKEISKNQEKKTIKENKLNKKLEKKEAKKLLKAEKKQIKKVAKDVSKKIKKLKKGEKNSIINLIDNKDNLDLSKVEDKVVKLLKRKNIVLKYDNNIKENTYKEEFTKVFKLNIFYKIFYILLGIIILLVITGTIYFFLNYGLLDKVQIEAGTKEITLSDFYKKKTVINKDAKILTDIKEIDLSKVGNYTIEIKIKDKVKKVKLEIKDTTKPKVVFQDIYENIDYKINPEDFIKSKEDISEMEVLIEKEPEITDYKDYYVKVIVRDSYNNETSKTCRLRISIAKSYVFKELGEKLTKADILYDTTHSEYVSQEDIDKINEQGIGEYEIISHLNNIDFKTKIKVDDTKAPDLVLKNVSIWNDQKIKSKDDFIKSVTDASKFEVKMKTEIDYSKLGNQDIIIEAIDEHDNKVEKKAVLTIKKDTIGPTISGLYNMTVNKYTKINFYNGVKAIDNKDGQVSFSVTSSSVNTNHYGTYYATYTAVDKSGNKTTVRRKITVNHDASDTTNKVNAFYAKIGSSNYEQIRQYIIKHIKYNANAGGNDPVWYGLTNLAGNCIVHAKIYQRLLTKAGYQTQLIYTTDRSHYWLLVKINGVWRHSDATPGNYHSMISAATDAERLAHLQGRDWDHSKWPKAE